MFPIVSVIIPAYNQAPFLGAAIDSVLAQTFKDYEIIVVNDGSTDETAQILTSYGERIRVVSQTNGGLSAARNSGLQVAQGKLIGLLDADDVWYPHTLSVMVSHLNKNPEIDLVGGTWDLIDELGRTIKPVNNLSNVRTRIRTDFLKTIIVGNVIIPSALLIRRKCFDCCGVFDKELKGVEDWDWLIRLAAHGHTLDLINTPVLHYRRHKGCLTFDLPRTEQATRKVLGKVFTNTTLAVCNPELERHAYVYAWLSLAGYANEVGQKADTLKYIRMAEQNYNEILPDQDLSLVYLNKLYLLSHTEHFMQRIVASTPQAVPLFYWLMMRKELHQKKYRAAFINLGKLTLSHPNWLLQKVSRKLIVSRLRVDKV